MPLMSSVVRIGTGSLTENLTGEADLSEGFSSFAIVNAAAASCDTTSVARISCDRRLVLLDPRSAAGFAARAFPVRLGSGVTSWTETAPFSYDGEFYKFDDFGPGFAPYEAPIPISIGGQSDEAFAVGGAKGDIFGFWGEPLDDLRSEIERVNAIARSSGRTTLPRIWVTFRPIVAATDELAWAKAHEYVDKVAETFARSAQAAQRGKSRGPVSGRIPAPMPSASALHSTQRPSPCQARQQQAATAMEISPR